MKYEQKRVCDLTDEQLLAAVRHREELRRVPPESAAKAENARLVKFLGERPGDLVQRAGFFWAQEVLTALGLGHAETCTDRRRNFSGTCVRCQLLNASHYGELDSRLRLDVRLVLR